MKSPRRKAAGVTIMIVTLSVTFAIGYISGYLHASNSPQVQGMLTGAWNSVGELWPQEHHSTHHVSIQATAQTQPKSQTQTQAAAQSTQQSQAATVEAEPAIQAGEPYYLHGTSRPSGPLHQGPVCLNTCAKARNGQCDDGRLSPRQINTTFGSTVRTASCDLGTDCDDCGPWTPSGHAPWVTDGVPGPIARLAQEGVQVLVRRAGLNLTFDFAYMAADKEARVSWFMDHGGVLDPGTTAVYHRILKDKCDPVRTGGHRGLMVDVGANFGWYSVLAGSLGCRVIAFEPVPSFQSVMEYNVHLNGQAGLVDLRGNVVSHLSGEMLTVVVPNKGDLTTAGIDGLNIDKSIAGNSIRAVKAPSQTLDQLIHEDVTVLKVDVEGWEWSVMQGAAQLLAKHNVENVVLEYSPGVPERNFKGPELKATVQMLMNLANANYKLAHVGKGIDLPSNSLTAPLPPYEEITPMNLLYDLVDAELFSRMQLGCPPVPALSSKFVIWSSCNFVPEDSNPRSLRSLLAASTRVWASKAGPALQPLEGVVGILPVEAGAKTYFVDPQRKPRGARSVVGQGRRVCADLSPDVLVRHRCPCTNVTACGEEERAIFEVMVNGFLPNSYTLTPEGKLKEGMGIVAEVMGALGSAWDLGAPYLPGAVKGSLAGASGGLKPQGSSSRNRFH